MKEIRNPEMYQQAIRNNKAINARKTWESNTPRHAEIEMWINKHGDDGLNRFAFSLNQQLMKFGRLSEKQNAAVLKSIDNNWS
jgi:hypothetical protein